MDLKTLVVTSHNTIMVISAVQKALQQVVDELKSEKIGDYEALNIYLPNDSFKNILSTHIRREQTQKNRDIPNAATQSIVELLTMLNKYNMEVNFLVRTSASATQLARHKFSGAPASWVKESSWVPLPRSQEDGAESFKKCALHDVLHENTDPVVDFEELDNEIYDLKTDEDRMQTYKERPLWWSKNWMRLWEQQEDRKWEQEKEHLRQKLKRKWQEEESRPEETKLDEREDWKNWINWEACSTEDEGIL